MVKNIIFRIITRPDVDIEETAFSRQLQGHVSIFLSALKWVLFRTVKQFVVTNCKERPGSIVTETLKNRIFIPIVTSKESHFNADFKYISFIKISYTHQKLLRKCASFQKIGGNTPKSHTI